MRVRHLLWQASHEPLELLALLRGDRAHCGCAAAANIHKHQSSTPRVAPVVFLPAFEAAPAAAHSEICSATEADDSDIAAAAA